MGLLLPSELAEPLGWIGLTWPEADEELLFEAGQDWITFGEQLQAAAATADDAAARVWTMGSGAATDEFHRWWTDDDGPERRLLDDAAAAALIGAAFIVFAVLTLALKIAFIVQLIILLVEVAQAVGTAFATFGATTVEIPGVVAATRTRCLQLIKQVTENVQTVIRTLLARARTLLRRAMAR